MHTHALQTNSDPSDAPSMYTAPSHMQQEREYELPSMVTPNTYMYDCYLHQAHGQPFSKSDIQSTVNNEARPQNLHQHSSSPSAPPLPPDLNMALRMTAAPSSFVESGFGISPASDVRSSTNTTDYYVGPSDARNWQSQAVSSSVTGYQGCLQMLNDKSLAYQAVLSNEVYIISSILRIPDPHLLSTLLGLVKQT